MANEARLRGARPADLPPVPHEDGDLDDSPRGRGRKSRSRSSERKKVAVKGRSSVSRVRTPPSSWLTPSAAQSVGGNGGLGKGQRGGEGLQRALEKSVVEQLAEENQRLKEELANVRRSNGLDSDSGMSWLEVGGSGKGRRSEGRMPTSSEPARTEGEFEAETVKAAVIYTPGGTQVPSGPPPEDELLPVPPPPSWMVAELDIYQKEEMKRGGLMGDRQWSPRCQLQLRDLPSPEQARLMWLERELHVLQSAVRGSGARQGLNEQYWSQPVHRWPLDARPEDRWWLSQGAQGGGPAEVHGDRAFAYGPAELHHDRAGTSAEFQQARASTPVEPHQVRASSHVEPHQGRASIPVEPHQGRASIPVEPHQVRASNSEDLHQDRACIPGEGHQLRDGGHGALHQGSTVRDEGEGRSQEKRRSGTSEDHYEDQLRSFPIKLPLLPDPATKFASLEAGDWITQIRPLVSDVSARASTWWDTTVEDVTRVYQNWLEASPLDRLRIVAPRRVDETRQSERLAQRVTSMLLEAVPQAIRGELIATRKLEVNEILFHIHKVYQPGGIGERQQMLKSITATKEAPDPKSAVEDLRLWKRQVLRCKELRLALPDGLLRVQALDRIMQGLLRRDGQASFRISTFRLQHRIDVRPEEETLENFFDLLLAEAEYMLVGGLDEEAQKPHGSGTSKGAVKAVSLPGGEDKSEKSGVSACKWWGSEKGCRMGKQCRFSHEAVLADRGSRCWLCSSKEHRKSSCPSRQDGGANGEGEKGEGKKSKGSGKSGGKQKGDGKDKPQETPTVAATSTREEPRSEAQVMKSDSAAGDGGVDTTEASGAVLMSEVTSLLKSIRMQGESGPRLRAYHVKSIGDVKEETLLDGGATHCMRQARSKLEWEQSCPVQVQLASQEVQMRLHPQSNTLLVQHPVQQIVPLAKLIEVGWHVQWGSQGCSIDHKVHGRLPVRLLQGCPVVDRAWGNRLMQSVEDWEKARAAIRAVMLCEQPPVNPLEAEIKRLKEIFPEVPLSILEKIPGEAKWDPARLPFNRRKRRQIEKAKVVVLNLFAGQDLSVWKDYEKDGVVIVHLDLLHGADLVHDGHLAGWIQSLAKEGKVDVWLGGPPCRSVSACRHREDDGPPPLRSRFGPQRFGLEGLSLGNQRLVQDDAIMFLRTLWWFRLAKENKPEAELMLEQPLDPHAWMEPNKIPEGGLPSFMIWPEAVNTFKDLGLAVVALDQGSLGHATRKPTALATNISEVQQLHGLKCDSHVHSNWPKSLEERLAKAKKLAQWAPGLRRILGNVILKKREEGMAIRSLTAKERGEIQSWRDHFRCGHLPYRNDCPTCLIAAGKDRQHRKLACPTSYCLSLDIAGPFVAGEDQESLRPKYFMVGVYTVPLDGQGHPLPEGLDELRRHARVHRCLDEGEECEDEDGDVEEGHPSEEDPLKEVPEPGEDVEKEEEVQGLIKTQELNEKKWKEFLAERRAMTVKNITFAVPLQSRASQHVINAASKIYVRARAMKLPITRVHSDRATEFGCEKFQQWCLERDIFHTMTSGDDAANNSRAEREVGWLKARTRTLLLATKSEATKWPLALRQASEERMRCQLKGFGIETPKLLPFGAKVVVRKKTWHHREDRSGLKWPMKKATLWGPACDMSASSKAYYVEDQEGRFFRTTVVHEVGRVDQPLEEGEKPSELGALGSVEDATRDAVVHEGSPKPKAEGKDEKGDELEVLEEQEKVFYDVVLQEEDEKRNDKPVRRRYLKKAPPVQGEEKEGHQQEQLRGQAEGEFMALQHKALRELGSELMGRIEEGKAGEIEMQQLKHAAMEARRIEGLLQVKAIQEVELNGAKKDQEQVEQVVQTRLVGMDEVKKNLELWKPAFEEEVKKLLVDALEPIDEKRFRQLLSGSVEVECLPMKAVATLKPEKRKARIVVCGNYAKEKELESEWDNAASGIDAVAIRTALNVMMQEKWTSGTTDVSSAFLKAPRRSNEKRITICEPPAILKMMGLVSQGERWIIHQALYGLAESPGDWGHYRDQCLEKLTWQVESIKYRLVRTPERHLWRIQNIVNPEDRCGFLLTYVDDMMAIGSSEMVKAALGAVKELWDCSAVEMLSEEKAMRFCGFELRRCSQGLILNQQGYTKTLLEKRKVEGYENAPLPKLQEGEDQEEFTKADLRAAQQLLGELLWLATKTRPDLSFATGALGRMLHKRPKEVLKLGEGVLKYINRTSEAGLLYRECAKGDLGEADHLQKPRSKERIDIYSDVSYAPVHEAYRSVQGIAVEHGGNLVAWETCRQGIVALSTCEAELISYTEAHQVGDSISELLATMSFNVTKLLHGDSKSAISAAVAESGSWRTRHLRLRAFALREALRTPESGWSIRHLAGEHLLADGFTKPLAGQAFNRFWRKLRMYEGREPTDGQSGWSKTAEDGIKLAAAGGVIAAAAWTSRQQGGGKWSGALMMAAVAVLSAAGVRKVRQWKHEGDCRALCPEAHGDSRAEQLAQARDLHPGVLDDDRAQQHGGFRACAMRGPGGDQMPIRPKRTARETQAGQRGYAAASSSVVLGSPSSSHPETTYGGQGGEVPADRGRELGEERSSEIQEVIRAVEADEMRRDPLRWSPDQCVAVTRLCGPEDGGQVVSIWDLQMFHQPPRGDDKWLLLWDHLLIRSHGRARTRAFHPLHRSTPIALERLQQRRCSILFPVTGGERQVKLDVWSQNLPFFQGQWKGYTVFDISPVSQPSSRSIPKRNSEESDGSYEVVEET